MDNFVVNTIDKSAVVTARKSTELYILELIESFTLLSDTCRNIIIRNILKGISNRATENCFVPKFLSVYFVVTTEKAGEAVHTYCW